MLCDKQPRYGGAGGGVQGQYAGGKEPLDAPSQESVVRIIISLPMFLKPHLGAKARWRVATMQTQRESVRCSTSVLEEGWGTWSGTASSAPMGRFSTSSTLSVLGGSMWTVPRQRLFTVLMMKLLQKERQPHQEQDWEAMELEEGELSLVTQVLWILLGLQVAFSHWVNILESEERMASVLLLCGHVGGESYL